MKLLEFFNFLLEDKSAFIIKNSGKSLLDAWSSDDKRDAKEEDLPDLLDKLQKIDPTNNKAYLVFIANMYAKKQFKLEDSNRLKTDLTLFTKVKSKLENKDLSSYKTLSDLYSALEPFGDKSDKDLASNKALAKAIKSDVKWITKTDNFKALVPLTMEAAKFYGANTKWCTAADDDNRFDHYHDQGNLIIIIAKDEKGKDRKFQFHVESKQFMNHLDQDLTKADINFLSTFPEYKELLDSLIKKHYFD